MLFPLEEMSYLTMGRQLMMHMAAQYWQRFAVLAQQHHSLT